MTHTQNPAPALMDDSHFEAAAVECEQALRSMEGQNINRPVLLEHLRRAFVQGMLREKLRTGDISVNDARAIYRHVSQESPR